jgi:hypothetical protein
VQACRIVFSRHFHTVGAFFADEITPAETLIASKTGTAQLVDKQSA